MEDLEVRDQEEVEAVGKDMCRKAPSFPSLEDGKESLSLRRKHKMRYYFGISSDRYQLLEDGVESFKVCVYFQDEGGKRAKYCMVIIVEAVHFCGCVFKATRPTVKRQG